jgi:(E)-4-hydroxy-3-methylbut-2-enyl-diphosphate synthase
MQRRKTKKISVGDTYIGGDSKISIQSMLNVLSSDIQCNINQAKLLEKAGCDILRVAIPDMNAVNLIYELKNQINIPLVADIHFDYRLAIESVVAGVDKIRINPGNIGDRNLIKKITDACNLKNIPIRIGVNSGSIPEKILEKYSHPNASALFETAMQNVRLLESLDFDNIIISMKSSNVETMTEAYKIFSTTCEYPCHLGVTEAGTEKIGVIKSSIGIGSLLLDGIGDTIRVSLTADPLKEIKVAKDILRALNIKNEGIEIISCPTCGRTKVNLLKLVNEAEERLKNYHGKYLKVAIMGCAVNGPGEAREADIGIACGDGVGLIFEEGKVIKKVKENLLLNELIKKIENN